MLVTGVEVYEKVLSNGSYLARSLHYGYFPRTRHNHQESSVNSANLIYILTIQLQGWGFIWHYYSIYDPREIELIHSWGVKQVVAEDTILAQ